MRYDVIVEVNKTDSIVEVEKFNPYHDAKGRFSTADGHTSFTYAPGKSKAHDNAIAREKERQTASSGGSGKLDIEKLKGTESADRGKASDDGSMKTAIVYHGSNSKFDEFDHKAIGNKNQVNQYGEGFYFADTPEQARAYGDHVYAVKLSYSTDRRTAKKTGRTQDFQYSKDTGIWTVPYASQKNAKIVGIADGSSNESLKAGFQSK